MLKELTKGLRAASDFLLPRLCVVCRRRLYLYEDHICLLCSTDMPFTHFWNMGHNPMADRLNEIIERNPDQGRECYANAAALFHFSDESGYREIAYQIKYQGNIEAGRHFGSMMGRRIAASGLWNDADMIIPVPLHWTRRWKRGYNQAEVIASAAAAASGIPMRTDILYRCRRTRTQTRLDVKEKGVNVAGAFAIRDKAVAGSVKDGSAKHLILIDDIFTTGSTVGACFAALRSVFPPSVRISVATLGFVGGV